MKKRKDNQELLVRYLLGEASEQEQHRIEEEFFTDDERFEQMLAQEDELMYDYAQGELGGRKREQFEKRFLVSVEGRRKMETARALVSNLSRRLATTQQAQAEVEPKRVWWQSFVDFFKPQNRGMQFALSGAALVVLVAFAWLTIETTRLRNRVGELQGNQTAEQQQLREQAERERSRADQLTSELERERNNRAALEEQLAQQQASQGQTGEQQPAIVSIVLMPGLVRDSASGMKTLVIPKAANVVRVQLEIKKPVDYRSYRVALLTAEGKEVWSRTGLRAQSTGARRSITVMLPVRVIADGDYEITLAGLTTDKNLEEIASYYFTAKK